MISPAIVLTLTTAVPAIKALVGDHVLIRPGHRHPIVLQRDLEDNAALAIAALDAGYFELTSSHVPSDVCEALRAVVGDGLLLPQSPPPTPGPPRLHRLK